jgi:hypothetical protein
MLVRRMGSNTSCVEEEEEERHIHGIVESSSSSSSSCIATGTEKQQVERMRESCLLLMA